MEQPNIYLLIFISSSLLSNFLIPHIINFGKRYQIFDIPSPRKIHKNNIVHIGGASILVGYLLGISLTFLFYKDIVLSEYFTYFFLIVFGSIIFFFIGFVDDLFDISPLIRLITQFGVASIMFYQGIKTLPDNFLPTIINPNLALILNLFFTIIWIVGITNAINWFDGLDGLASGVCVLTLISFSLIFTFSQNHIYSLLCVGLTGSCIGFLRYNFFPSRIMMGDCGSNLLGFNLAIFSITQLKNFDNAINTLFLSNNRIIISLLLLSIPLLDMIYVILKRIKNNRSPFYPDRYHLHHRLMNIGFSHRNTVVIIYSINQLPICIALYFSNILNVYGISFSILLFLITSKFILKNFFKKKKFILRIKNKVKSKL